jgi:hypothetical protein
MRDGFLITVITTRESPSKLRGKLPKQEATPTARIAAFASPNIDIRVKSFRHNQQQYCWEIFPTIRKWAYLIITSPFNYINLKKSVTLEG